MNPPPPIQFKHELRSLEREARALFQAITGLSQRAHEIRGNVTDHDVALLREAVRDTGKARQIVQGIVRKWRSS